MKVGGNEDLLNEILRLPSFYLFESEPIITAIENEHTAHVRTVVNHPEFNPLLWNDITYAIGSNNIYYEMEKYQLDKYSMEVIVSSLEQIEFHKFFKKAIRCRDVDRVRMCMDNMEEGDLTRIHMISAMKSILDVDTLAATKTNQLVLCNMDGKLRLKKRTQDEWRKFYLKNAVEILKMLWECAHTELISKGCFSESLKAFDSSQLCMILGSLIDNHLEFSIREQVLIWKMLAMMEMDSQQEVELFQKTANHPGVNVDVIKASTLSILLLKPRVLASLRKLLPIIADSTASI